MVLTMLSKCLVITALFKCCESAPFGPQEQHVRDLYQLYQDSIVDVLNGAKVQRRAFINQSEYEIHISKLKSVNGFKKHNIAISRIGPKSNKTIYINNPLEAKLSHPFMTLEEFKEALIERQMKNREELMKSILKTKLLNAKRPTVKNASTTTTIKEHPRTTVKSTTKGRITLSSLIIRTKGKNPIENKTSTLRNITLQNSFKNLTLKTELDSATTNITVTTDTNKTINLRANEAQKVPTVFVERSQKVKEVPTVFLERSQNVNDTMLKPSGEINRTSAIDDAEKGELERSKKTNETIEGSKIKQTIEHAEEPSTSDEEKTTTNNIDQSTTSTDILTADGEQQAVIDGYVSTTTDVTGSTYIYCENKSRNIDKNQTPNINENRTTNIDDTNKTPMIGENCTKNIDQIKATNIAETETTKFNENKSLNTGENETTNMNKNETTNMNKNETKNIDENDTKNVDENETKTVVENETTNIEENETTNNDENDTPNIDENETTDIEENEKTNNDENETSNIDENETTNTDENETTNIEENETTNNDENETTDFIENETTAEDTTKMTITTTTEPKWKRPRIFMPGTGVRGRF